MKFLYLKSTILTNGGNHGFLKDILWAFFSVVVLTENIFRVKPYNDWTR